MIFVLVEDEEDEEDGDGDGDVSNLTVYVEYWWNPLPDNFLYILSYTTLSDEYV